MDRNEGQRFRTPTELEADVQRLLDSFSEHFAALAWEGYQRLGRGAVMASEVYGAVFCPSAEIPEFPIKNLTLIAVLRGANVYDPETEVLLVVLMSETEEFYGHVHPTLFCPEVAPPLANKDPMFVATKDELRH